MWISKKRQKAREQAAYEHGLSKGYDLAWQMRQSNLSNKGFVIAGGIIDRELDEIQTEKRREE